MYSILVVYFAGTEKSVPVPPTVYKPGRSPDPDLTYNVVDFNFNSFLIFFYSPGDEVPWLIFWVRS